MSVGRAVSHLVVGLVIATLPLQFLATTIAVSDEPAFQPLSEASAQASAKTRAIFGFKAEKEHIEALYRSGENDADAFRRAGIVLTNAESREISAREARVTE